MMIKPILYLSWLVVLATGCASAPSRFYTLSPTAKSDGTPAVAYAVAVGPVSLPALVDRPQFTVQVTPNRVEVDEFNRWAAPLRDNIAGVIAGNLAVLLGTPQVTTAPLTSLDPAYRVTLNVRRFESQPGTAALIEVVWVVRRGTANGGRSGYTQAREPVAGPGFDALVAAHSRALAKVSGDIAAAIRAEVDAKP